MSDVLARVIDIWSSVLEQVVGADDDFFKLGGDSLLALQVATLFQEAGHPGLPASAVLRWRTPADFASALQRY